MLINFDHLKTTYNALVHKLKSFRGNWNQNDPTADDYIKNKPFYEEIQTIEPIIWDGNTEGLLKVGVSYHYYKVSDQIFSDDQIKALSYNYCELFNNPNNTDENYINTYPTYIADDWDDLLEQGNVREDVVWIGDVIFVRKEGVAFDDEFVFPETGVYFYQYEDTYEDGSRGLSYVSALPAEGSSISIVSKIDEKYLPQLATVAKTGSYNDLVDKPRNGPIIENVRVICGTTTKVEIENFMERIDKGSDICLAYTNENGTIMRIMVPAGLRSEIYMDDQYWDLLGGYLLSIAKSGKPATRTRQWLDRMYIAFDENGIVSSESFIQFPWRLYLDGPASSVYELKINQQGELQVTDVTDTIW